MRKSTQFIFLTLFIALMGCASYKVPPSPITSAYEKTNVGILIDVSDVPKHTHIGTTIFNNFNKEFDFKWNMKDEIFTIYKNLIESKTNLNVINLDDVFVEIPDEGSSLVVVEEDSWTLNEDSKELRDKLITRGIDVLILIREDQTLASLECNNYGCTEMYSRGQGVFSRSFFGYKTYFASASYDINVESINPVVKISLLPKLREALFYEEKNRVIKDFKPTKLKEVTESDMEIIKSHIINYMTKIAEITVEYLNGYVDPAEG